MLTFRWAQLEIHTNPSMPDSVQAYHAGFIEGYLTADLIGMYWKNILENYCDKATEYCNRLFEFLETNLNATITQVMLHRKKDPYWHQVGLVLEQLTGLQD